MTEVKVVVETCHQVRHTLWCGPSLIHQASFAFRGYPVGFALPVPGGPIEAAKRQLDHSALFAVRFQLRVGVFDMPGNTTSKPVPTAIHSLFICHPCMHPSTDVVTVRLSAARYRQQKLASNVWATFRSPKKRQNLASPAERKPDSTEAPPRPRKRSEDRTTAAVHR